MAKIHYNDEWEYEIHDNGYEIWGTNGTYITQFDPYGKIYLRDGTYEENALMQLADLSAPFVPGPEDPQITRSDLDYLALMMDVDLPSYDKEGE